MRTIQVPPWVAAELGYMFAAVVEPARSRSTEPAANQSYCQDLWIRSLGCLRPRSSPSRSRSLSLMGGRSGQTPGLLSLHSGGSAACNSRTVISAVFGDGKPTEVSSSSNSSLAQRARTRSSDSHAPMMYRASSPIAQWWRSSPAPVAPPLLMINACALSYACRNCSTSPLNRAINMTAIPCLQILDGHNSKNYCDQRSSCRHDTNLNLS